MLAKRGGKDIEYPKIQTRMNDMKVLVSLPDELYSRMKAAFPLRQRSRIIAEVLREEIERRENELYQAALAAEQDQQLNAEMAEWEITIGDGIEVEPR
jgi:hypothetical protein